MPPSQPPRLTARVTSAAAPHACVGQGGKHLLSSSLAEYSFPHKFPLNLLLKDRPCMHNAAGQQVLQRSCTSSKSKDNDKL